MALRRECTEMKRYLKEMQLADRNIDATDTGLPLLQVKKMKNPKTLWGENNLLLYLQTFSFVWETHFPL